MKATREAAEAKLQAALAKRGQTEEAIRRLKRELDAAHDALSVARGAIERAAMVVAKTHRLPGEIIEEARSQAGMAFADLARRVSPWVRVADMEAMVRSKRRAIGVRDARALADIFPAHAAELFASLGIVD